MTKKTDEKKKRGAKAKTKPPYQPTAKSMKQVEALVAMGASHDQICLVMDVSKPTLYKYYRKQIDTGAVKANSTVAQALYAQATGEKPNITAAIFWLKARAGWQDNAAQAMGKKEQRLEQAKEVAESNRFSTQPIPIKAVK